MCVCVCVGECVSRCMECAWLTRAVDGRTERRELASEAEREPGR